MIKYERIAVTAKLAAQWLEKNSEDNRNPKSGRIPGYARDMASGRWNSDSGETIKFDVFGNLIDGQNRLFAVIQANATSPGIVVEFDVARGLPSEAMQVIDSGASRTFSDTLKISGTPERARVSAIVRWVAGINAGTWITRAGRAALSNAELWDAYRVDSDGFDAAGRRAADATRQGLGIGRAMGTAFYLFARIDREQANQFFDGYVSGAGLLSRDPILALRNRIVRQKLERQTAAEQLALTIRAWNYFRAGEKVDRLQLPKGLLTNDNFPQPK